ncbi:MULTISPECIES: cupin domain-containing protein [Tatumella]|uniref:(R)-mandelonitrile lyase n=1 Tax=unclassified Tatumella TaxID=2649542 RepID=UPI001BAF8086|nr:cupin domain-containing protein [Tatumella sp. JGM16]MBS0877199.1 cupin domain-containing protein [Tatumella sp. JGM82]MBS0889432.1 cupin domain-containing protein [Tatumella sp. JGM94]MBS0894994.1 cupin domain-containing protein [Tatumella sp. JGM130]MBS0901596.1 cupin domain-containing protein [Tatumella sp. JGM100]MBS0911663.1 cupin domain-containing protein [Tatumella sp. JGM91]
MTVLQSGDKPSAKGPDEYFTGTVRIDAPFCGSGPATVSGATVTFEPSARTAWHTHPLGQTLIITAGTGFVCEWERPLQKLRPGDIVWIPAGVKHWHGASPQNSMTHIAIAEAENGSVVEWMEKVTDEQYAIA